MNNTQMETFIRVADAGSFNKSSEDLYITPTAVIKQINLLETELEVPLFERTHRGLTLTKAGESLYKDAKYIIEYCRETVTRAKNAMLEENRIIRIGTSPMTPAQILMDLWPKIHEHCSDLSFHLVTFENTPENAKEILRNLGQNIDVVTSVFDETFLEVKKCLGYEISREPLCLAMSINHPLAKKDKLTMQDLYGQNLMMIHRGWSRCMDTLRDVIIKEYTGIKILDFEFYDVNVFNRCEINRDILLVVKNWACVHPMMKVIPVEWDYSISFGLLYPLEPSETVQTFLAAVKTVTQTAAEGG